MHGHLLHGTRDIQWSPEQWLLGTCREASGHNPAMNDYRKSDKPILPEKSPNKAHKAAEGMEGRGLTKGILPEQNTRRTLSRERVQSALERIRKANLKDRRTQFTSLYHQIYSLDSLKAAYLGLKKDAAAGVDGQTWTEYGAKLDDKLSNLSERLRKGTYQAKPVRRVFIPKTDGTMRPLGVTALEDKIVQSATVGVLNAVYEPLFAGFSYGFRPGRGQHQALDAVAVGITSRKVNWVLDADIRGFFDAISHDHLIRLVKHKIGDLRVIRLIQKWLKAGVLEDGTKIEAERGTPQGGCVSPVLANIYLHYVYDSWVQRWRKEKAKGDVIVVRYADDSVVGFQHRWEALRFLTELRRQFSSFELELHPEKTRILEFGRFAAKDRKLRGERKPETFDFLGFTHYCSKSRTAAFQLVRKTSRKRMSRKLVEIKDELKRRMHHKIPDVGTWLGSVLRGHYQYFAVPLNSRAIATFRYEVVKRWKRALSRRSQKARVSWERMSKLAETWLPKPKIVHPYPSQRLVV